MHIVTAEEMYRMDRFTVEDGGVPGILLMENAGRAVANSIEEIVQEKGPIVVLIGTGNNGGDGFVIARTLLNRGHDVRTWLIPPVRKLKGDAMTHYEMYRKAGYKFHQYGEEQRDLYLEQLNCAACIVDSLLGIGVEGTLKEPYVTVIKDCRAVDALKVAVDLPSGVPANGDTFFDDAFQADMTITLQYPKQSAYTFPSASYYGKIRVVEIGIGAEALNTISTKRQVWQKKDVQASFPKRLDNSHKSHYGKGLLIAGANSMSGAAVMASKAAVRSGTGLLSVSVPSAIHPIVASQVPEAMVQTFCENDEKTGSLDNLALNHYEAVAAGPGLGRSKTNEDIVVELVKKVRCPLILDADGLYHVSSHLDLLTVRTFPTILTPHSGEMSRLTGISVDEIERDRFGIARRFAVQYGVYLVLKGRYTIVTTPQGAQYVNVTGNAALAKGGSGDVLTGMILAFVLQQEGLQEAISNAVYFHGRAADWLIEQAYSKLSVTATDIIETLPNVLGSFE